MRSTISLLLLCAGIAASLIGEGVRAGEQTGQLLRLSSPNREWTALSALDIKRLFTGHALLLDEAYMPAPNRTVEVWFAGGCPPKEHFYADGRWKLFRCDIVSVVHEGNWEVAISPDNLAQLCVSSKNDKRLCRTVWQGSDKKRLFMLADTPIGDTSIINPYILSQISIF